MRKAAGRLTLWMIRLAVAIVLIIVTALVVVAFVSRDMPPIRAWHHVRPGPEFSAADARRNFSFADYLELENQLFAELPDYFVDGDGLDTPAFFSRYLSGGMSNPTTFEHNWNRSTELVPDEVRGTVLLLHGLSDSPYSMRSMAEVFRDQGFYTLCLRLPGHGSVPAGLLRIHWEDWVGAVEVAARHVRAQAPESMPFYICGYSNGGALAVHYALQAVEEPDLPSPNRLILFSPCIGVSALAVASNWHRILSWMPYFEQSRWLSIEPEFDPYKYNSFPKNAGAQAWDMTQAVQSRLERASEDGLLDELPPILAFQSLVDATVIMEELISRLFDRLTPNGSELVLFDVNRAARTEDFIKDDKGAYLARQEARDDQPYRLTVVGNRDPQSTDAAVRSKPPRSGVGVEVPLDLAWPRGVYSLAHVAIPFSPDDPLYGVVEGEPSLDSVHLGSLAPRGEVGILTVSASQFLRLRHNPFHPFMVQRVLEAIAADDGLPDGR